MTEVRWPVGQKKVSIFICSSSDVPEERDIAWEVINATQEEIHSRFILESYRWEIAGNFISSLTYQKQIPLPSNFDIFIGILYSRLGKPLNSKEYQALIFEAVKERENRSKRQEHDTGPKPNGAE